MLYKPSTLKLITDMYPNVYLGLLWDTTYMSKYMQNVKIHVFS